MKNKKLIGTMMCAVVLANLGMATLAATPNMFVSAVETTNTTKAPNGMREFEMGSMEKPVSYKAGEEIYWEGKVYKVLQTHMNRGELWYPDVPALFEYVRTVAPEEFKQEIMLGGDAVGSDAAHKDGFYRVRLDMLDGKLSLIKNSDYNFHHNFDNKKYVSIKVTDNKGKVLYNKSWNGNQSITDMSKGKMGEFASYQLAEGSAVEVYHAEGTGNRFYTSNDTELKNKKAATTYNYVVKEGQLELVTDDVKKMDQVISLGGQAVGTDDAHKSGFARLNIGMHEGKLSLIKNSDYQYHWYYNGEKYASVKISDEKGKVLYDKSWNGNDKITDLPYQKFGEFAAYQLAEGSTVEVYHAEGTAHRFHTSNDAELKAKKVGTTYKYVVENQQLKLVTEVTPIDPPTPVVPEVPNFDGKTVNIVTKTNTKKSLEYRYHDEAYGIPVTYNRVHELFAADSNNASKQQWQLVKVKRSDDKYGDFDKYADDNTYFMINKSISSNVRYLTGAGAVGSTIRMITSYNFTISAWWRVEKTDVAGEYRIVQVNNTRPLTVNTKTNKVELAKTVTDKSDQRWLINLAN